MSVLLARIGNLKLIRSLTQDAVYRDLIGKSAIAFLIRNFGVVLSMIFNVAVARLLGPGGLGSFAIMQSLLLPLSVATRLGLDNLQVRLVPQYNVAGRLLDKAQSYRVIRHIIMASSLVISAGLILLILWGNPLETVAPSFVLAVIAAVLPFHALYLLNIQTLKGEMRIDLSATLENIVVWVIALVLLLVWKASGNPDFTTGPVLVYSAGILLAFPLGSYWVRRLSLAPTAASANALQQRREWQLLLRQSLPMWSTALVSIGLTSINVLMLAWFVSNEDVGIYSAGVKLVSFMAFPLTAIINIAAPRFAEAFAQNDTQRLFDNFRKATRLAVWGAMPIFLLALLLPGPLLSIFGESFTQGNSVVYLLALGQLVNVIVGPIGYLLWMSDNAVVLQYIMWATLAVSVILNYFLIPVWGINGAAIAMAIALAFKNLACWVVVQRRFGFSAIYIPGQEFVYALVRKQNETQAY